MRLHLALLIILCLAPATLTAGSSTGDGATPAPAAPPRNCPCLVGTTHVSDAPRLYVTGRHDGAGADLMATWPTAVVAAALGW